jgi:hypothetical protein
MSIELPNFEAEYEKAKQYLSFFEDVIAEKEEVDSISKLIEHTKAEFSRHQSGHLEATFDHEKKEKIWKESQRAHESSQNNWNLRGVRADDILFRAGEYEVFGDHKGLKNQIESARENVRLLEERLAVGEHAAAAQKARKAVEDWATAMECEGRKIQRLEQHWKVLRKQYDEVVE